MIQAALTALAERTVEHASRLVLWPRWQKRALVMAGDAILCVAAVWLAFSLRLGEWRLLDWPVVRFSLTALALWFPIAIWRGVYRAIFRYTGRGAIVTLTGAVLLMAVPLTVVYIVLSYPGVPRTIALMQPLIFLVMISTARIVGRYVLVDLFHSRAVGGKLRRVLIYGAGRAGQQLAASLPSEAGTQLIGFVDDDPMLARQRLDGVPVHHSARIEELIARTGVTDVLLAISGASLPQRQAIVRRLEKLSVNVKTLPPMREFIEGKVTVNALRTVEVEDLLGRVPVEPDKALLDRAVRGKRVMITGAGGSIGSEICRQVFALGPRELVLVEANEFALFEIDRELGDAARQAPEAEHPSVACVLANVADRAAVKRLFERHAPDTVFHAAAFKHVPLVEANVIPAIENNLFGTRNVALEAEAAGVERFILISTDKAVRPPNVMGATKRACELVLQALNGRGSRTIFTMVRFGNVLNSSGSVVPLFRGQIAAGGPVTVTHRDVTRYFMTIPEAAQLVIQAAGAAKGGEVFLLDMGEPVKIWDMAHSMVHLAGLTVRDAANPEGDIEIVESGLRPGEKLYEELLIGDNPLPTAHPRIMQAREHMVDCTELDMVLEQLEAAAALGDETACRILLRTIVPTLEVPADPPLSSPINGGQRRVNAPRAAAILSR
jgi:FlaA1/EpsC-like NDP-sugar epimerase